jgi:LemA protein
MKRGQAAIVLLILLGLFAAAAVYGVHTYNRLVKLHEQIPAAWSQVENVLQRRNDLIPNLVNTVKGFAKQEQMIYGQISAALQSFSRAQTISDKLAADNSITGLLGRIMALSVQYPKLQSNENFQRLQDELSGTENRIAVERMRFNEIVQEYNSLVKTFPTNLVARLGGFSPSEAYFKAEEGAHSAPKVQF